MGLVTLVSGGLDSTLVAVLTHEQGILQSPLFVDYGQRAAETEWRACSQVFQQLELPTPSRMNLSGFGAMIRSGLTDPELHVADEAFLPGRNLILLSVAASFAFQVGAQGIAFGLLNEGTHLFPDQRAEFLEAAGIYIEKGLGRRLTISAPLMGMNKAEAVALARQKNITGTYSCHTGDSTPCGLCISCKEMDAASKGAG